MANSIVSGLFGIDPLQYQAQQDALANQQAMQFAEMDPFQRANYGLFRSGQQIGKGVGEMLGAQDPQLKAAGIAQKLAGQFDTTTVEGLKQYAQALQQAGADTGNVQLSNMSMMALDRANALTKAGLENIKTQSEISKNLGANTTEVMKTQQAIAALKAKGDPNNEIPALQDRLRSLVKSDIPPTIYNSVIAPQTEKYNTSTQNKAELDRLSGLIDSGILKFGPTENFRNKLKTIAGSSTEGSRAAADFQSTLETIRLQAQILQKGSQTDRDAANIMNSFLSNVDKYDTQTVRAQLSRISKLMENQASNAQAMIKQTEDYYGGSSGSQLPSVGGQQKQTPQQSFTPTNVIYPASVLAKVRAQNTWAKDLSDAELSAKIAAKQSR